MKKICVRIFIILAVISVVIVALSFVVDEPLRRYMERELNSRLKGYSIEVRKLDFHPVGFSIDLENISVYQKARPQPPIAEIARIHSGLRWRDLLTAHIVADAEIDEPKLYLNIENLAAEIKKPPAKKEAWQHVLEAFYPFTVNEFRIRNGELTYVESRASKPVRIKNIVFIAHNIKNVKSAGRSYPSDVFLEAVLFDSGKIKMNGEANFLLEPFLGIKADIDLQGVELTHLRQVARLRNILIEKGVLSGSGNIEFSPERMIFILKDVTLSKAEINYLYTGPLTPAEKEKAAKAKEKLKEEAKEVVNKPGLLIKAKRIKIDDGDLGIVNKAAKPNYRIFMNNLDFEIENFSNHFSEGPARVFLKGQFMGSGETVASGTFRPEKQGPDFNIRIAIKNTQVRTMNNVFRAYGNFDVSGGLFSFYSDLTVRHTDVSGYVKPLFSDLKVYDKRKDKEKSEFRKLYEEIIGGVAKLLENPYKTVATKTPVTGKIENPKASTWDALLNLVQNAFFHSILPGFEKNIR